MKAIAFTSVVLLHLFCSVEGSLLAPVSSISSLVGFSDSTCDTPGVALLSCTVFEVVTTYISLICNSLRVLENLAPIIECLNRLIPEPFKQILQVFYNSVAFGSKKITDLCTPTLDNLDVKGKCPNLNLFSVINKVLISPLTKDSQSKIACGKSYDAIVATVACTIIELVTITVELFCLVTKLGLKITTFLACLSIILPSPLDAIVSSIFNGLSEAGVLITSEACATVLNVWNADINAICPGSFANVSNFVSTIFKQLNGIL